MHLISKGVKRLSQLANFIIALSIEACSKITIAFSNIFHRLHSRMQRPNNTAYNQQRQHQHDTQGNNGSNYRSPQRLRQ